MMNGKLKAITFSFDDGTVQDRRLIELLDKYNMKATFNLNSKRFGVFEPNKDIANGTIDYETVKESEVKELYKNHEVAGHTLTHPLLTELSDEEIIREIEEDRINLSKIVGHEVYGFAYPNPRGAIKDFSHLSELAAKTGIKYARTTTLTDNNFEPCTNLFDMGMNTHIWNMEKTIELAKEFLELKPKTPKVFYIMGHSYEFAVKNNWEELEEFFKLIANKDDIFYGTNSDIYLK